MYILYFFKFAAIKQRAGKHWEVSMASMEARDVTEFQTDRTSRVSVEKPAGHWLLVSLGKTVLRPGGPELTERLVDQLSPGHAGDVLEIAPGIGVTAQLTLDQQPYSYTAVKWEESAARKNSSPRTWLGRRSQRSAENVDLPSQSFTVVYGEATLTMEPLRSKLRILRESHRLLQPGGWYGVHELGVVPGTGERLRCEIGQRLSGGTGVSIQPLMSAEWRDLLRRAGFQVLWEGRAPMYLSEPQRLVGDARIASTLRWFLNALRGASARKRAAGGRRVLREYRDHLEAIAFVCRKEIA
jgi:SAM-dependent methyltransferase